MTFADKNIRLFYYWISKKLSRIPRYRKTERKNLESDMIIYYMKGINSYLDKGQNSGVKITTWIFNHLDWGYSELIKIQKKQESIRHFDPEDKMIKKEFEEKTIFNEDTIDLISIKEQFSEVKKCLELLTKKQQEVIYCHFYHGMTFDQIGKKYQCTRAATNYHYNNGIKKIRELMGVK